MAAFAGFSFSCELPRALSELFRAPLPFKGPRAEKMRMLRLSFFTLKILKQPTPVCDLLVIGSSVAFGIGTTQRDYSWVSLLSSELTQRGVSVINMAFPGLNTTLCKSWTQSALQFLRARVVLLCLNVSNNGLAFTQTEDDGEKLAFNYVEDISVITKMIESTSAKVVLGGVYPNDLFDSTHYKILKETETQLRARHSHYIEFLTLVGDGVGHWKQGCAFDAMHPNDAGHRLMYQAADGHVISDLMLENSQSNQQTLHEARQGSSCLDDMAYKVLSSMA